jgi:hypothetical protein
MFNYNRVITFMGLLSLENVSKRRSLQALCALALT